MLRKTYRYPLNRTPICDREGASYSMPRCSSLHIEQRSFYRDKNARVFHRVLYGLHSKRPNLEHSIRFTAPRLHQGKAKGWPTQALMHFVRVYTRAIREDVVLLPALVYFFAEYFSSLYLCTLWSRYEENLHFHPTQ